LPELPSDSSDALKRVARDTLYSLYRVPTCKPLRFFGGLTETEAAEALDISLATLKRDWDFARSWLATQLA